MLITLGISAVFTGVICIAEYIYKNVYNRELISLIVE